MRLNLYKTAPAHLLKSMNVFGWQTRSSHLVSCGKSRQRCVCEYNTPVQSLFYDNKLGDVVSRNPTNRDPVIAEVILSCKDLEISTCE